MAGPSKDLEIVIGADLAGLKSDLAQARSMFQGLARNIERVTPSVNAGNFARVTKDVKAATAGLVGFTAKAAIAGGTLVALEAGLSGLGDAFRQVKEAVAMAAEFEQNQIAFESMLGSAEKAAGVMGDLRKFAADTPFSSKEVTEGARQLLAYGVAADNLIPTLKTLGTISAAYSTPFPDEIRRWGTNKVQGHLMQQDINQYTNAGIPVIPGLAKALNIDESQLRKYTEESRVDLNALNSTLTDLANNRFGGMLEKQAKSLRGSWEQMTDAFDRAKLKLGQVIAQEVGLKDSAKGLEGFADKLERAIDGDRFRSGVRFVGDLVKGGAQLASEFGGAGVAVASIIFEGFERVSPQFKTMVADAKAFAASLSNLKFDKRKTAEFAFALFDFVADPLARAVDYANVEGRAFADSIQTRFIDPIKEAFKTAEAFRAWWDDSWVAKAGRGVDDAKDRISRASLGAEKWDRQNDIIKQENIDRTYLRQLNIDRPATFEGVYSKNDFAGRDNSYSTGIRKMADVVRYGRPEEDLAYFNAPRSDEPKEQVRHRYDMLQRLIGDAEHLVQAGGVRSIEPFLANLRAKENAFFAPYTDLPADPTKKLVMKSYLMEARLPPRRPDYRDPEIPPPPKTAAQTKESISRELRDAVFGRLDRDELRDKVRGHFGKMYEGIRKEEALRGALAPLGAAAALGPLGGLAAEAVRPKGDRLTLPGDDRPPAHLVTLAEKLNDEFDPLPKLMRARADMEDALRRGLIGKDAFDKGWGAEVRGVADRLGVGQPARLADGVTVGSQEDAKLLSNFFTGTSRQATTDDLLRQIRDAIVHMRDTNAAMERAPVPQPVNVSPFW